MSEEIYQRVVELLPRLRRYATGLAGSVDAADDLVQEACARLLSRPPQDTSYLDRWLFRTIRNLHIDQVRGRKVVERHRHRVDETGQIVDGDIALEAELTLEQVRALLAELPEEQRSVLLLVGVEGFSYRQAADTLQLPIGTVTSRLARARDQLWRRIRGHEPASEMRKVQR